MEIAMYKRTLAQSFILALVGLKFVLKNERNMKIHLAFATLAILASIFLKISNLEFLFVIFAITIVLIAEAANTAFELLLDFVHGDKYHPDVKILKDVAAGGVFIAALSAAAIGLLIFVPRIVKLIAKT
jgi:diacylglycerol kinase